MKKIIAILLLAVSTLAFAEASFDEIQGLIDKKQYSAAAAGLEVIIQNHPKSAKAFYAMAEAQAGLGNLEKAQKALNLAKGLDPTLKFVSEGSVRNLEKAITPQTQLVTYEEPSHWFRNFVLFVMTCGFGYACYYFWCVYNRKKDEEDKARAEKEAQWAKEMDEAQARHDKFMAEKREAQAKAQAEAEATPQPKKTKKQLKEEADALALREATARAEAAEAEARRARMNYSSTPAPTVVHTSGGGVGDFATGMILGNMMSNHHETTRVVEREVIRESAPSRSSSWDDSSSSSSSRSSSWDDDSSSKRSSSWDDSSSSSSSSSWDSGSSSSDSSSSSSWD